MESDDRDESFLTVAEVAEVLKLNQQTVRNWIDQGSLPAVKVGRRVRIRRSDFQQLLDAGSSGGSRPAPGATGRDETGPSAQDFWGGEPVGVADPDPTAPAPTAPAADSKDQPGQTSDKSGDDQPAQ
jgi:excisionase family DNA binding protein